MGKKKRQNKNSNNNMFALVDSSESESSKDSAQVNEAAKHICPHLNKSLEFTSVKKNMKILKDKNKHLQCWTCSKNKSDMPISKDCWVCLRCGSVNCGPEEEDHRVDHYKAPRSDTHYLAFQINTSIIWCFKCEREIPIDINKKVQSFADLLKKQCSDHFSPGKVQNDIAKMNGDDSTKYLKQDASLCQPLQNTSLSKENTKAILELPKVKGLSNLGNTCFFNSVLQCLAQTPGLVDLLLEMEVPGERFHIELDGNTIDAVLEKVTKTTLSEQLAQVLTQVRGVENKGGHFVVNPRSLLQALTSKCPQFEGGDQHDAHELLRHLLDSVHTEDLRRYQKAILNHIGYNKCLDKIDEDKKQFGKKLNHKVCETIAIRPDQIFRGSLVSILQCSVCNHISKREETFLDMSLPVAQEKAQPPVVRRKQNCSSPVEEEQSTEVTLSKHQLKKAKRMMKKARNVNTYKSEQGQGEPSIQEEDKKDSIDGEQSDADVEDNEDNVFEEQDNKAEVVESGYSSEKQMSARGSPITTQTPEDESKPAVQEYPVFQGCDVNPDYDPDSETLLAKRAESGLGSIQELTVNIPDETNAECTSQDSVRVNASNGSPDISSDSQQGHFKSDLLSFEDKLPPSNDSQLDRTAMIYEWNCTEDPKSQSQGSSSVSLSVSPQCVSEDNINVVSPKCSPKGSPTSGSHSNDNMSVCTSLPNSNDNMSLCNSLPGNVSMVMNSPTKSHLSHMEENSGSEERPESRMECQKNRSSPVELGEQTELDSSLLKLSLEEMTYTGGELEDNRVDDTKIESPRAQPVLSESYQNGLESNKSIIPIPPALPMFTATYSFTHPEPSTPRFNSSYPKYKIEEGEFSLQSCLNQFTTIEMLAGGNKVGCEACTERMNKGNKEGKTVYQNSTKQLLICKLPPIMIFHLKRFQVQRCSFRKICRHVDFPLVLDISPYCSDNKGNAPILYSLYGVVEHSGTLHGGHYVAYVKVRSHSDRLPGTPPPGKWYYISDSRVSDIDETSVLKTQAYLLFYERIL